MKGSEGSLIDAKLCFAEIKLEQQIRNRKISWDVWQWCMKRTAKLSARLFFSFLSRLLAMATPYLKYLAIVVAFFSVILYGIGTEKNEFIISESFAVSKHDLFQFLIVSKKIIDRLRLISDLISFL